LAGRLSAIRLRPAELSGSHEIITLFYSDHSGAAALPRLIRLLYASFEISDVLLQLFIHLIDRIGVISCHYFETRRHIFHDAVYF
jgi:hypothetical protein